MQSFLPNRNKPNNFQQQILSNKTTLCNKEESNVHQLPTVIVKKTTNATNASSLSTADRDNEKNSYVHNEFKHRKVSNVKCSQTRFNFNHTSKENATTQSSTSSTFNYYNNEKKITTVDEGEDCEDEEAEEDWDNFDTDIGNNDENCFLLDSKRHGDKSPAMLEEQDDHDKKTNGQLKNAGSEDCTTPLSTKNIDDPRIATDPRSSISKLDVQPDKLSSDKQESKKQQVTEEVKKSYSIGNPNKTIDFHNSRTAERTSTYPRDINSDIAADESNFNDSKHHALKKTKVKKHDVKVKDLKAVDLGIDLKKDDHRAAAVSDNKKKSSNNAESTKTKVGKEVKILDDVNTSNEKDSCIKNEQHVHQNESSVNVSQHCANKSLERNNKGQIEESATEINWDNFDADIGENISSKNKLSFKHERHKLQADFDDMMNAAKAPAPKRRFKPKFQLKTRNANNNKVCPENNQSAKQHVSKAEASMSQAILEKQENHDKKTNIELKNNGSKDCTTPLSANTVDDPRISNNVKSSVETKSKLDAQPDNLPSKKQEPKKQHATEEVKNIYSNGREFNRSNDKRSCAHDANGINDPRNYNKIKLNVLHEDPLLKEKEEQSKKYEEQERLLRQSADRARFTPQGAAITNKYQQGKAAPIFLRPLNVTNLPDNHWTWTDLYSRLGLPKNSSDIEIRKQFRKLALLYHPDKTKHADGPVRFQAVKEAYELLCKNK